MALITISTILSALAPLGGDPEILQQIFAEGGLQSDSGAGLLRNAKVGVLAWIPTNAVPVETQPGLARYLIPNAGFTIGETSNGQFDGCYQFPNGCNLFVLNNYFGQVDGVGIGAEFPQGFVAGSNSSALFFALLDPTQAAFDSTMLPVEFDDEDFADNQSYLGILNSPGQVNIEYHIVGLQMFGHPTLVGDFNGDGHVDLDDYLQFARVLCGGNIDACTGVVFAALVSVEELICAFDDCDCNLFDFARFQNQFTGK